MSSSEHRSISKILNSYLIAFAFCSVFAIVYELFAKGIISFWMLGMPLFPFVLGVIPALILEKTGRSFSDWALQIWNCGVITLTVGSVEFLAIQVGLVEYDMNQEVFVVLHPGRMNVYNKKTGRLIKFAKTKHKAGVDD
ncbi:MAG: hypothetical protein IJF74_02855 [Clostridia bacterium]|nr:hypothetical protein [Clostridia bacterium]